jgi:NAD(P)-dependent dehydrogenase (short-subunit alcohol dehydrogenase family)
MVNNKSKRMALITGGAIRVGERIARFLHSQGYQIFITYNKSKQEAEALKEEGIVSQIFKIDFLDFQLDSMPKIDLLINNASIFEREEILDLGLLKKNLNIHLLAPIAFADILFRQEGFSHIINILDDMGQDVGHNFISYYMTKKLLEEATRLQSKFYYPKVRVNAVAPKILIKNQRQSKEHFESMIGSEVSDPVEILLEKILFLDQNNVSGKILH